MTKKIFVIATLIIGVAFFSFKSVKSNMVFDLASANIEAMSQGEAGTKVGECYVYNSSDNQSYAHRVSCDTRTTDDTIYPCPGTGTSFNCNTKLTHCTK